jgi:hypothetical protein
LNDSYKAATFELNQYYMGAEVNISQPFSNLQLELLKLYASNVPDEDLLQIRDLLAKFFFEKAKDAADRAWEEKNLTEQELINRHRKTTSLSNLEV